VDEKESSKLSNGHIKKLGSGGTSRETGRGVEGLRNGKRKERQSKHTDDYEREGQRRGRVVEGQ
jgi:hypothetical protein